MKTSTGLLKYEGIDHYGGKGITNKKVLFSTSRMHNLGSCQNI